MVNCPGAQREERKGRIQEWFHHSAGAKLLWFWFAWLALAFWSQKRTSQLQQVLENCFMVYIDSQTREHICRSAWLCIRIGVGTVQFRFAFIKFHTHQVRISERNHHEIFLLHFSVLRLLECRTMVCRVEQIFFLYYVYYPCRYILVKLQDRRQVLERINQENGSSLMLFDPQQVPVLNEVMFFCKLQLLKFCFPQDLGYMH